MALADRMLRAARLDASLYEEVEADTSATGQATLVVILASLAAGVGTAATQGLPGLAIGVVMALLGWYVWAFLTYVIGTRVLSTPQTQADLGELLRTIGFSASPGILRVLGVVPGIGQVLAVVASIWMLVAMVVAVRQALDYESTGRAILVCLIGWIVQLAFLMLAGVLVVAIRGA